MKEARPGDEGGVASGGARRALWDRELCDRMLCDRTRRKGEIGTGKGKANIAGDCPVGVGCWARACGPRGGGDVGDGSEESEPAEDAHERAGDDGADGRGDLGGESGKGPQSRGAFMTSLKVASGEGGSPWG